MIDLIEVALAAHWTDSYKRLAESCGVSVPAIMLAVHEMLSQLGLPLADKSLCSQGRKSPRENLEERLEQGHRRAGAVAVQWCREKLDENFRPEFPKHLLDSAWKKKYRESQLTGDHSTIHHPAFGVGFVLRRVENKIVVLFESGERTLING